MNIFKKQDFTGQLLLRQTKSGHIYPAAVVVVGTEVIVS